MTGQNGKKWEIIVKEKFGPTTAIVFDSKKVFGELNRPIKAVDLLEQWLREQPTFPYESHSVNVMSNVLNRPLAFKEKDKDE